MSTSVSFSSTVKNTSSWVRPGVFEVRARPLRLVSALMRLDLPTLERPAKAISSPFMAGREEAEPEAETKRHSGANSRRPAPISPVVKVAGVGAVSGPGITTPAVSFDHLGPQPGQAGPLTPALFFF